MMFIDLFDFVLNKIIREYELKCICLLFCLFICCNLFIPLVFLNQHICLFVLGFYGPVNNEVMSSRSVNSGTVPGQA